MMKRFLSALLVAAITLVPASAFTAERWPLEKVFRSIARLDMEDGSCTATSVGGKYGFYLTAAHCIPDEGSPYIAGRPGLLVEVDAVHDLAVYSLMGQKGQPPIELGLSPQIGDEVLAVGYGGGWDFPSVSPIGVVFANNALPPWAQDEGIEYRFDSAVPTGGMSGGPVINRKGQIVGLVKCGAQLTGCGPTYSAVARLVVKYR
jgi:hypothetical protein